MLAHPVPVHVHTSAHLQLFFYLKKKSAKKISHKYRLIIRNVNSSDDRQVVFGLGSEKPLWYT